MERTPLLRGDRSDEDPIAQPIPEPCTEELSSWRLTVVFGSIWIIVVVTALDSTIVATLTASISASFSSLNNLSWMGTAYLVASAATQPLAGRLTDVYGRRAGLQLSGLVFGVGTLICGCATHEWMFILGRAIAGAGGGATTAISTFVGADLVPLRRRGVIQGLNNIAMGCGTGLGGLLGGQLDKAIGWKAAFLVQLPFIFLGLVLCTFVRDIPSRPFKHPLELRRIDYLGSATLVLSVSLLLVGLSSGGNETPWDHPLVITTISLSALFFITFICVEIAIAEAPILPLHLMLNQTVISGCATYFFAHMAAFATMYYLPIYLQLLGNDPTGAGLRFIPQSIGTAVGAYGSGVLIKATGNYTRFSMIAHILLVSAAALMATMDEATLPWRPFLYLGIVGTGFGAMLVTTMLALISSVEHSQHALITSASFAFRAIGSSGGITVASVVFQNSLSQELKKSLGSREGDADELIEHIRRNFDAIWELPSDTQEIVKAGYMRSLHFVFIAVLAMSLASMASSLVLKQNRLHDNLARR